MCDLSDISIKEAYNAIIDGGSTNWMMLGYHDDTVITLLAYGDQGLNELRDQLIDEPWYGFLRLDSRFVFIDWMPQDASDSLEDRRKRHIQQVMEMIAASPVTHGFLHMTATTDQDLSDESVMHLIHSQQLQLQKQQQNSDDNDTEDDHHMNEDNEDDGNDNNVDEDQSMMKNQQQQHQQQQYIPSDEELQEAKAKEQERWTMIKQQMVDAKETNEALLVGHVSVKSDASPLWRRRYIVIQNRELSISMDNSHRTLVKKVSLDELTRYGKCDPSLDCYITNAVVLETKNNEIWQLLADNRNELDMILVALDIVSNK
ncbi:hypothetical protein BCR42DRAFT_401589 [Absidia repens]|uniref:ADF-H domain-containing protein n=1 Tax=Absidia repens TaxID=90262 RepID=A0A1X2J2L8_9FUNG|nr:hypothetical protein BCR42DRAFT_401589 [Absidia repens]